MSVTRQFKFLTIGMRGVMLRKEPSFLVEANQREALSTTMCIIQNFGPMGFLIQEECGKRKFKV